MQLKTMMLVLVLWVCCVQGLARNSKKHQERNGKFFGIFNIVSFPNNICKGTNDIQGVCLTYNECSGKGGESSGSCASGFGICCAFISMSDSSTGMSTMDIKVSYLQNPKFPQTQDDALVQMTHLVPIDETICQIRLDFLEFQMDGGSAIDKPCDRDMLKISGIGGMRLGVGDLCGNNKDQHLYIPVNGTLGGPAILRVVTAGRLMNENFNGKFKWNIKVTQLDCTNQAEEPMVAPAGCDQYHRGESGKLKSFNFDGLARNQYGRNLKYTFCMERPREACEVKYTRDPDISPYHMSVGKARNAAYKGCHSPAPGQMAVQHGDTGCRITECMEEMSEDYLLIVGGVYSGSPVMGKKHFMSDHYCGNGLGEDTDNPDGTDIGTGVFSQAPGPVAIRFITDDFPGAEIGTGEKAKDDLGWSINYKFSSPCTMIDK